MARVSRIRSYTTPFTGKKYFSVNGVMQSGYPQTLNLSATSSMTDSHGRPVTPSSLTSTTWKGSGLYWDGETDWWNGSQNWHFKCDRYPVGIQYGGLDTSPTAAPSGWLLSLVAGTNPSRPVMAPPTLIQDLVSIPSMLRDLGKLFRKPLGQMTPKELASHYLCAQFGWKPLIDDIMQLLDLQASVLKRAKELQKLYAAGGLRRRIRFSEETTYGSFVDSTQVGFGATSAKCNFTVKCEKRVWGTIRWHPTSPPPFLQNDDDMNRFARRLVLGLTVEGMAKGLWDVIPWTWLLGWFTNLGKYLWAHSLTVPASWSDACLMRQSIVTVAPGGTTLPAGVTGNMRAHGLIQRKSMTRIVSGTLTPGFNMPFMDMFRLSIMGALFTQRFKAL